MLRELLKKHVPYAEITRVPHCKRDTVQKGLRFGGRHTGRSGRAEIDEAFHRPTDKSSGFLRPDCAAESRFRYYSSTASPAVHPARPPRELQAVQKQQSRLVLPEPPAPARPFCPSGRCGRLSSTDLSLSALRPLSNFGGLPIRKIPVHISVFRRCIAAE